MKLRLPSKLVAAILAAASPVLLQTLSSATLGVAAVAAVAGHQAVGEWIDNDFLLDSAAKPAEGAWNVDLTEHEIVNLMEKGGLDASRQAQLGTVTLSADAALTIASNVGHGETSAQNFTDLRIATLSFGDAANSGSLTVNSWNTATVTAVTGSLAEVNVQANGKLTLGAAGATETTVSRVNGGLVNGELRLNMSTDAEGSGDGVIKLDEASAGHVYVDSGVFATNKQYGALETNLGNAKLHLANATTFLVRNSVGTGDITPVKDAYLKGSLTFRVYGSVGADTRLTTNFHKDAGAGETVITRTDSGNITLTGAIDLDKFISDNGTTNFAGTANFGTSVALKNNTTINVTSGTFTTATLTIGNNGRTAGNFSVSQGAVANIDTFQNSWGFNTATINGVLNTQYLWMTSGGANNNLTGTGIINADKVALENNGSYHFTGIRLNVGAQGIINNRPTTMTSVTLGAMTDWTMTSSGVTYSGDMVIDTSHWDKETNTADSASAHTITFNEAFNEMSGTPLTSLAIEGTGTVIMKKAANIAHADVTLSGGTLELQKGGAFGSIKGTSGNLILAGNNTLQVGGPISLGSGSLTMGANVQLYMTPAAFAGTAIGAVGFSEDDGAGHRDGYAIGQFQLATAGSIDLQGQPSAGTLEVRDLAAGGQGLVLTLDGTEGGNYMVNWNVDYSATATGNHNAYGATNIYLTTPLNETTGQHSTLNVKSALNGVQSIVSNSGVINLGEGVTWTVSDLNKVSAVGNGQTLITGDGALKVTSTNDVHSMVDKLKDPLLTFDGTVQISGSFNEQNANYTFDKLTEGTNAHLEFVGFTGFDNNWFNGSGHGDFASDVVLTDNGSTPAWKLTAGTSGTGNYFNATGKWSGTGTFQTACNRLNYRFNNDISEWEGTFDFSSGNGSLVLAGAANEVNAEIKKSGGTLAVVADTDVVFNNKVQADSLTVNAGKHATLESEMNVAAMTVNANGALTLGDGFSMKDGVTAAISGAGSVDVHKLEGDTETLSIHDGQDGYVTAVLDLSRYQNKVTFGQTGWMVDGVAVGTTADGGGVSFDSDNYTLTVSGGKYFQVNTTVTMDEVAAPAGGGRAVLVGDGTYVLGSNFVTDNAQWTGNGQISTDPTQWTGTVQLTGTMKSTTATPYDLNDYANSASWVELRGLVGYDRNWNGTLSANIKLTDIVNEAGEVTQVAWNYEDALSSSSVNYMTASGAWKGTGTFAFHQKYQGVKFTGDISEWEGAITSNVGGTKSVWFAAANAMEVNAAISRTVGTMDLRASTGVTFNKAVTADKLTVDGNGKVSFNEATALSEIVVNSNITTTIAGTGAISLSTATKDHGLQVNSGATVNIETHDLTIANGALFDMGGKLNIGNGTDETLVKSKWLVTGNVNNWGTSALNINKNATIAVSGNDTNDTHQTGVMFSEWNNNTTITISGNLLAMNASVKGNSNSAYYLNVEDGGVLAVKGVSAGNANSTFTLKDGGTLILGGATSNNTGSTTLQAGSTIGISADSVTFARNAVLSAADGKAVTIDTEKYAFNADGTAIAKPVGEQAGGTLNISGSLSGDGALTKVGAGTLTLGGASASFAGAVNVEGGTLKVTNDYAFGAVNVTGGTFNIDANAKTVNLNSAVTMTGGTFTLTNGSARQNSTISTTNSTINIDGGTYYTGSNGLVIGEGSILNLNNSDGGNSRIRGSVTVQSGGTMLISKHDATGYNGGENALQTITVDRGGKLLLGFTDASASANQNETFSGTLVLNGTLDRAEGLSVNYKPRLDLFHSAWNTCSGKILVSEGENGVITENVRLHLRSENSNVAELSAADNATLTVNALVEGTAPLKKTGNGALILNANNTYTGATTIANGAILATNSGAVSETVVNFDAEATHALLAFKTGATYNSATGELTGGTAINGTVKGLSGTKGQVIADGLTINTADDANLNFSGDMVVSSLTKQGGGTQTLSGNMSALNKALTVNSGTLALTGTLGFTAYSATISDGGHLKLTGSGNTALNRFAMENGGTLTYGGGDALTLNANSEPHNKGTLIIENGAVIAGKTEMATNDSKVLDEAVVSFDDHLTAEDAPNRVLAFNQGGTYNSETGKLTGGTMLNGTIAGLSGHRGTVMADTLTIDVENAEDTYEFLHRYDESGHTDDNAVLVVNKLVKNGAGTQVIGGEYTTERGFTEAGLVISGGVEVLGGTLHMKTRGEVTTNFNVAGTGTLLTTDNSTNCFSTDGTVKYDGKVTLHGQSTVLAGTLNYADGSTYITGGLHVEGVGNVVNAKGKNQFINGLYGTYGVYDNVTFTRTDDGEGGTAINVLTAAGNFGGTVHLESEVTDGLGLQVLGESAKDALAGAVIDFMGDNTTVLSFRNSTEASADWANSKMDGSVAGLAGTNGAVYANALTINTANGADYIYGGALEVSALTKQGNGEQTIQMNLTTPKTINRIDAEGGVLTIENSGSEVLTLSGVFQMNGELVLSHGLFAIGRDDASKNTHGLFATVDTTPATTGGVQLKHGATLNLTAVNNNWRFQLNGGVLNEEDGLVHGGGITIEGAKTEGDDTYAASVFNVDLNDGNSMSVRALNGSGEAAIRATSSLNYSVGSSNVQISNAEVSLSRTADTATTMANQLVNVYFTNAGSAAVNLTNATNTLVGVHAKNGNVVVKGAASSKDTLDSIKATGADVTLEALGKDTKLSLSELVIGDSKTVEALVNNTHEQNSNKDVATIEVTGTLTVGQNANLNANLVMKAGSTYDMSGAGVLRSDALNLGCALTLEQGGNLTLSTEQVDFLKANNYLVLFDGVDSLTLGGTTYENYTGAIKKGLGDVGVDAADYYQTLINQISAETHVKYYITYSGANNGGIVAIVPEPATSVLSLLALAGMAARRRRK